MKIAINGVEFDLSRLEVKTPEIFKPKIKVSWCIADLDSLDNFKGWTDAKKEDFFNDWGSKIADAMVAEGWRVIHEIVTEEYANEK